MSGSTPADSAPASPAPPAAPPPPVPAGLSFKPQRVESTGMMKSAAILAVPKVGKTTLAASASKIPQLVAAGKKVLIMENEAGTASIADQYPDAEFHAFTNHIGFMRAINELLTVPHDYGVVVIDTFDGFQEYAETFYLANAGNDTRAAYGKLKKWTLEIADALHKAPFTVIFLFHTVDVKDERTGMVKTTFKLIGSAGDTIGKVFDMIAHLTIENDEAGMSQRVLQLAPKTGTVTGNRWEHLLPAKMINATMPEIFAIIRPTATPNTTTENKE